LLSRFPLRAGQVAGSLQVADQDQVLFGVRHAPKLQPIHRKRGALNHRIPKESLVLLTPWEDLVLYQWASRTARDYFCPTCGILPFRRPSDPTPGELREGAAPFDGWAVNVRCLEGVDLASIPVKRIYGSRIGHGS